MKKILSVLLAAAMLLSVCIVSTLPVAASGEPSAENDQFVISTHREDFFVEDDEDRLSRPGGVYVDGDGFQVNPLGEEYADYKVTWPNNSPYVTIQTEYTFVPGENFYMEVRIDDFVWWNHKTDADGNPMYEEDGVTPVYDFTDTWYSFHVWDSIGAMPGQVGENSEGNDFGHGMEMLIRPKPGTDLGYLHNLEWYDDTEISRDGRYRVRPQSSYNHWIHDTYFGRPVSEEEGAETKLYLTFELRWDDDMEYWVPYVNGYAPDLDPNGKDVVSENMTKMIMGYSENSVNEANTAYIGFSIQTFATQAPCSFTITKIGTSKDDAQAPIGDENDSIPAEQRDNAVAEITVRDPEADEAEPAFVFTGDRDSYKNHRDNGGSSTITNTEDGTLKISSHAGGASPVLRITNDRSYDLREYPIEALIVKNLCTCEWPDENGDGVYEPTCNHTEKVRGALLAGIHTNGMQGTMISATEAYRYYGQKVVELRVEVPNENGGYDYYDVYLFNYQEMLDLYGTAGPNRIHGVFNSYDGLNMEIAGRNEFEIVAIAHLATIDGAVEWSQTYLQDLLGDVVGGGDVDTEPAPDVDTEPATDVDTEPATEEPTEAPTEEPTEEPTTEVITDEPTEEPTTEETTEETTEAKTEEPTTEETSEETTEAKTEEKTEEPTDNSDDGDKDVNINVGCTGVAGFGALAIVAVAAIGLVSFKKKEN